MRTRRRAIGVGAGYVGSQISSLWTRRISISSRWPSVTSRPVGAPSISIIVLSAVVVPCTTMSRSEQSWSSERPLRSATSAMAFITPVDWSSSVVGVLSSWTRPSGGTQMTSVNWPPTSTPMRSPTSGPLGRAPLRPELFGRVGVDGERQLFQRAGEHDAVLAGRGLDADVLVEHVVQHRLRVAVERASPAAASAVVVHDPLAGRDRLPVRGVLHH